MHMVYISFAIQFNMFLFLYVLSQLHSRIITPRTANNGNEQISTQANLKKTENHLITAAIM